MTGIRHFSSETTRGRQRGAALIVALIFMVILAVIGVSSMQTATMQERMSGNAKDASIAFQAAEAALRQAEARLAPAGAIGVFNGTNGNYIACANPGDTRTACAAPDWADKKSVGWVTIATDMPGVVKQPEYILEQLEIEDENRSLDSDQPVIPLDLYRVTARGYGFSDRTMVVLSTTFNRNNE
ncbi:MAG: PilX N-terminal domain-containing pilus assembly protein [Spongiibacter sp.]|nr:PilX N-terminal domain-containing pilus assembly protein [Spongiibacter sp.]